MTMPWAWAFCVTILGPELMADPLPIAVAPCSAGAEDPDAPPSPKPAGLLAGGALAGALESAGEELGQLMKASSTAVLYARSMTAGWKDEPPVPCCAWGGESATLHVVVPENSGAGD